MVQMVGLPRWNWVTVSLVRPLKKKGEVYCEALQRSCIGAATDVS